jgi:dTDP-glucose pyrophosphorylase
VISIEKRPLRAWDRFRIAGAFGLPDGAFTAFDDARPSRGEFELESVMRLLMEQTPLAAVLYDGWRKNVNTLRDLHEVRERARSGGGPEREGVDGQGQPRG